MSLTTIAARFTDEPVKLEDADERADERKVLTKLKMTYEGGSLDGKTANFPRRDVSCVVVGLHWGNRHFFETYKRTTSINIGNHRTIFRCSGGLPCKSTTSSGWKRLLAVFRIRKLKAIII